MPVLDTNFLICLATGDTRAHVVLERLAGQDLIVPFQAAVEYLVGVVDRDEELRCLNASFRLAHSSDEHVRVAAALRAEMRDRDIRPRYGDLHIGAVALANQTYVVTKNKRHFRQMNVAAWHYEKESDPPQP